MDIRYAIEKDREQIISLWDYCFEDQKEFVDYYFENVYDEKNTLVVEEENEV
ncbi:MAG: GNAT family N-acetyltransferase, partial [Intestinibacter sp.]